MALTHTPTPLSYAQPQRSLPSFFPPSSHSPSLQNIHRSPRKSPLPPLLPPLPLVRWQKFSTPPIQNLRDHPPPRFPPHSGRCLLPLLPHPNLSSPPQTHRPSTLLFDSLADPAFRTALFHLIAHSQIIPSPSGPILGLPGNPLGSTSHSVLLATEQSNSAILYDQQIFLKVFRRLQPGINPDAEILQFLAQRHFPQVPAYSGSIEFHSTSTPTSTPIVLALAMTVVPKKSDAWDWARLQLTQQLHAVIANDSTTAEKLQTHFLQRSHQLGAATGQLHLALASDPHNPHFSPEPLTPADLLELSTELLQTTTNLLLQLPLPHPRRLSSRPSSRYRQPIRHHRLRRRTPTLHHPTAPQTIPRP
ncbi:MAG: hypothetical protein NTX04_00970 [Verrucomicrobia bacterium]|nr:hypothetical protein [Verrucomicrobiota bacterium]